MYQVILVEEEEEEQEAQVEVGEREAQAQPLVEEEEEEEWEEEEEGERVSKVMEAVVCGGVSSINHIVTKLSNRQISAH